MAMNTDELLNLPGYLKAGWVWKSLFLTYV